MDGGWKRDGGVDEGDLHECCEAGGVGEGGSDCLCTLNPDVVASEAGMMGRRITKDYC